MVDSGAKHHNPNPIPYDANNDIYIYIEYDLNEEYISRCRGNKGFILNTTFIYFIFLYLHQSV